MIENIIGLIKVWILTQALTNPLAWVGILLAFSVILLVLAIFVKFKNGFVSLVCFIIFEAVGVVALVSLLSNHVYQDDLCLREQGVLQCTDVKSKGIVHRKRFRAVATPLLGVTLPEEDSPYFEQARDKILSARFNGNLYVYTSSVYSGVVLYDSELKSINEQLLQEGLASTTKVTPKQYSRIQTKAIQDKKGMWAVSAAPCISTRIIAITEAWLVFVLSVGTSLALMTWLRNLIKKYAQ